MDVNKNLCVLMFYIVLLFIASILFLYNSFVDYLKGDTQYVHSLEPISLHDLPTITACILLAYGKNRLIYGKDFVWQVKIFEAQEKTITLLENQSVPSLFGINIELTEFLQTMKEEQIHKNSRVPSQWQCYKITSQWNGNEIIDFKHFYFQVGIKFNESYPVTTKNYARFWVTSEGNSYGLARRRWLDGNIYGYPLDGYGASRKLGYLIRILQVMEYNSLHWKCSKDSYYQCLARKIRNMNFNTMNKVYFNGTICQFNKTCAPFTLPDVEKEIPLCSDQTERACFESAIDQLEAIETDTDHCKTTCQVVEYKTEPVARNAVRGWNERPDPWSLRYRFVIPHSSKDLRIMKPFKYVHKEYLIVSGISLIGNVGGTLGLFVGFSVLGTTEWFMTVLPTFLIWVKQKWSQR